jgi:TonB family protein
VEALVDEKGEVFAVEVVQSVDPALDAVTVKAVRDWKFTSATIDDKPVMKVVRIPIDYNLVDSIEKSMAKGETGAVAAK